MKQFFNDTDNLIYNRYDLIHADKVEYLHYTDDIYSYEIQQYNNNGVVEFNIWGKTIPLCVLEKAIENAFTKKEVISIKVERGCNQYRSFLEITNDIRVPLPDSFEELMNRAERRDRATIRRKLRWVDERVGELKIDVYSKNYIPNTMVETYFRWKKETHGTDYGLTTEEYLKKYYVTDAMLMRAGDVDVAVAFFCQVENIVFFENFSYNSALKAYSPGLLMYVKFMEELIRRKCKYLYLGGGSYVYKKRFGAETYVAYSGVIYRQEIVDAINSFFEKNKIKTVAIYGFGVCGHAFYQLSMNLRVDVEYAIDKRSIDGQELSIYSPDDDLPKVDAALITMNSRNKDIESLLSNHLEVVYYWNEILDKIISDYRRRVNAST